MGHALSSLGRHTEAADAYSEAFKLGPHDPYVRHLVAASGILPGASRAPGRICAHCIRRLRRSLRVAPGVPRLSHSWPDPDCAATAPDDRRRRTARSGARSRLRHRTGRGCALRPAGRSTCRCRSLPSHAAKSRPQSSYTPNCTRPTCMNLLAETATSWPLIIAADVLIYFGALTECWPRFTPRSNRVAGSSSRSRSCCHISTARCRATAIGRWAGRAATRTRALMSPPLPRPPVLPSARIERQTVRFEADAPVAGIFVVLERAQRMT